MGANGLSFGKYIESIRTTKRKSLRETAKAIGVSPQFYSEVEKDRRCAFTADRLELLRKFLEMSVEEAEEMNNKAAESYKGKNVAVPQDFADYIVERDYVMSALRTMKEMDADEEDWKKMVDEFIASKKGEDNLEAVCTTRMHAPAEAGAQPDLHHRIFKQVFDIATKNTG